MKSTSAKKVTLQPGVDIHDNVNYASFSFDAQSIFAAQELNSILALTLMTVVDEKRQKKKYESTLEGLYSRLNRGAAIMGGLDNSGSPTHHLGSWVTDSQKDGMTPIKGLLMYSMTRDLECA